MERAKRTVVVGIPGVGKSTVISHVMEVLREKNVDSNHVIFGTLMLERGLRLNYVKHRDEMRKLPVETQRALQLEAAKEVSSMDSRVVIIDTHLFINTKEGYFPGLPHEILTSLRPTNFFLVEANPSEISERRAKDAARMRETSTKERVESELALARAYLAACSILTGAPLKVVMNEEGKPEMTAKEIVAALALE